MIAVLTGLLAGIIHVWSGPDHLAAIAPLAVRRPKQTWIPGAKWGIGHSAGVAIIGVLSLFLRDVIPVNLISTWGERMVGVMLIGIGCWALRKAFRVHAHEHVHDGERHLHMHAHPMACLTNKLGPTITTLTLLSASASCTAWQGVLIFWAFCPFCLPSRAQALGYLAAFAAGTIISMAAFSWIMGLVASRWASEAPEFIEAS